MANRFIAGFRFRVFIVHFLAADCVARVNCFAYFMQAITRNKDFAKSNHSLNGPDFHLKSGYHHIAKQNYPKLSLTNMNQDFLTLLQPSLIVFGEFNTIDNQILVIKVDEVCATHNIEESRNLAKIWQKERNLSDFIILEQVSGQIGFTDVNDLQLILRISQNALVSRFEELTDSQKLADEGIGYPNMETWFMNQSEELRQKLNQEATQLFENKLDHSNKKTIFHFQRQLIAVAYENNFENTADEQQPIIPKSITKQH